MGSRFDKEDKEQNEDLEKTVFYDIDSIKKNNASKVKQHTDNSSNQKKSKVNKDKISNKTEKIKLKEKGKKNRYFFRMVWFIMVILLAITLAKYMVVGLNDMLANNRQEKTVSISIPKDSSLSDLTNILYDNGVIEDKSFFKLYSVLTNSAKDFTNGDFDIKTNMDYEALVNYLQTQSNRTDIVKVTLTEGMNVMEYAALLEQNEVCIKDDFLKVCKSNDFDDDYDFIKSIPNESERYYKLEGYLFPDTYQFYKYEDPNNTVDRFLSNFSQKLRTKQKVTGYENKVSLETIIQDKSTSVDYIINVASIIQAEAADIDDMYMVASVIYNRLSTLDNGGVNLYDEGGMGLLGMDSTVWYPYRMQSDVPGDISQKFKSRYNTYDIQGLPPGPICNPGMDAIDAALNPADTDYYYFCHSEDGTAYYAKTSSEHKNNLVKAGLA